MIKILRKSFRKRIAILLLAVFLIPLVPIVPVSATGGSPFPFDYPSTDTFYPVDFVIKLFNVDGASYFRVRTDTGLKISYWKMGDPVYTIPVTPDPFSKYTFYDSNGNVVDNPFVGTRDENLLLFRNSDEDTVGLPYGIVQASNANLYSYDEGIPLTESDTYIYFYANYVSLATTPTPTPVPEEEPTEPIPDNDLIDGSDLLFLFKVIDENNIYYNQYVGMHINNMLPWLMSGGKIYLPYFKNTDGGVTCTINNAIFFSKISGDNPLYRFYRYGDDLPSSSSLNSYIDIVNFNTLLNASWGWSSGGQAFGLQDGSVSLAGNVGSQSLFEIVAFNHYYDDNLIINFDSSITPTPTPTAIPTPTFIPQPTSYPTPTVDPPDSGEDNNWTGLFGWLRRIRDSILNIPKKIASGLLDALKYIFIPDINRVKNLYADLDNKVGIVHPPKFEFTVNDLRRPNNVYYDFHPISVNGETAEPTRVTIIDFEKIDEWLDSDESEMFRSIIKACFSLLVWGYMIYVFTKHIGSINYTDAQRLEGVYKRSNEVGGDETDV